MPTAVTNYQNTFDKFYFDCNSNCIPKYQRSQPLPAGKFPTFIMNIDVPISGAQMLYYVVPYPCKGWNCGTYDNDMWTYFDWIGALYAKDATIINSCALYRYPDTNVFININRDNSNATAFFNEIAPDFLDCDTYGPYCFVVIEVMYDPDTETYLSTEIIAKSIQSYVITGSIEDTCGIIGFDYVPKNNYGFPSEYTGGYNYWTWGKVWKPILDQSGTTYIKSNGFRQVLNMQLTEQWTMDIDMNDYSIHKAIHVASNSESFYIYNKDMNDFYSGFTLAPLQQGYRMSAIIKENYTYNYVDKCFSSMRGKAVIINNEYEGLMYGC